MTQEHEVTIFSAALNGLLFTGKYDSKATDAQLQRNDLVDEAVKILKTVKERNLFK
jgi:hypothetical protein